MWVVEHSKASLVLRCKERQGPYLGVPGPPLHPVHSWLLGHSGRTGIIGRHPESRKSWLGPSGRVEVWQLISSVELETVVNKSSEMTWN